MSLISLMKLTGVRQKVFLDRYSLKDKRGRPLEKTPEAMWRRVAAGIAAVEKTEKEKKYWCKKFYEAMKDFKFVPGGRILSGAGSGYKVTFYNCLPPDQEVLTPDGYKPIREIRVGDLVITGKKRTRRVRHVFTRKTKEPIFSIRPTKLGFDKLRLTGEHPILAIKSEWVNTHRSRDGLRLKEKPSWIKARDLREGDFVAVAWDACQKEEDRLYLQNHLPDKFIVEDGYIVKEKLQKPIKNEIKIDEDFMLFSGFWLADGCVTHRTGTDIPAGIQITFNKKQHSWAQEVGKIIEEKFHVVPTIREDRWGQKLIQVRVESYPVGLFFKNFFGAYSYKKKIPQLLMEQPRHLILPLVKGLFRADGYLSKQTIGIAISNRTLAMQLHQLLLKTGRFFSIFENSHPLGRHETYRLSAGISQANGLCEYIFEQERKNPHHDQGYYLEYDGLYWVRISSINIKPYEGRVFDLEVEEDHSFISAGVIVSNCFVLPSPPDSREGILQNLSQMVEIMARGGGVGINLSSLRPRGARVRKVNGFSSGPINWAELYSTATKDIIQQGGSRRGALMLMLWDWHPDIEEFITVKKDLTRITGANLSVCISDRFMRAVEKDEDWQLLFPETTDKEYDEKWSGDIEEWVKTGKKVKIYKKVKARKLWEMIAESAWASAEPGVVFMERYNKLSNTWYFERINCVNPCVTGDTLVATENGWTKAKDLKRGEKILTVKGFKPIRKFYNNGKQKIYRTSFSDGGYLKATADHQLRVIREGGGQSWVRIIDLKRGDKVVKLGFLGAMNHRGQDKQGNSNKHQENNNHHQILAINRNKVHDYNFAFLAKNKLKDQIIILSNPHNITAYQSILSRPVIIGGKTATAKTTCPAPSKISESFLSSKRVKSGLSINKRFPFLDIEKILQQKKLINKRKLWSKSLYTLAEVVRVEDTGKYEEVYDVLEPETLTWVTNGYLSLDCGEEGLPPYGVCNLCSINLAALVDKKGNFDFEKLKELARVGVRFQDNIVEADFYVFPKIREVQMGERRIGLGTMGLGDALIKMRLHYGSGESLQVIDKIYKTIRNVAYETSAELAKERGPFPNFEKKKYLQGKFIQELPKRIEKKIAKFGIRNSVLLQQAPTGSTSLLAGVSSGIEPVYEFEFIRRDRLGEHVIRHPLWEEWLKKNEKGQLKSKNLKKPEYFVSANDLTPKEHVRVQATIQKYVDASISKTVNAPASHSVEEVKKLYTLAYKLGCKGITYMREESRPGVLERRVQGSRFKVQGKKEREIPEVKPRPVMVSGATYQIQTPVGKAYITINTNGTGEPLELFINVGKAGSDVAAMAEGLGRMVSLNLRLRSSIPPLERVQETVVELSGIGGSRSFGFGKEKVRSLPDAIAKVLAKHFGIKNGNNTGFQNNNGVEKVSSQRQVQLSISQYQADDLCPECGLTSLAYEEGCKKCYSCGYSEC